LDSQELKAFAESDTRQTSRDMARQFGVSYPTILAYLKQIEKKKRLGRWVSHKSNDFQKERRLKYCKFLLEEHNKYSFLERNVTVDEKWVMFDNTEREGEWVDADKFAESVPKKVLHPKKVMIMGFWNCQEMIHYKILKEGETIDAKMCKKLGEKYHRILNRDDLHILHDNARSHTAAYTKEFLKSLKIRFCHIHHTLLISHQRVTTFFFCRLLFFF
jgi:transposase